VIWDKRWGEDHLLKRGMDVESAKNKQLSRKPMMPKRRGLKIQDEKKKRKNDEHRGDVRTIV